MGSSPSREQRKNSNSNDLNTRSETELQVKQLLKENEELKAQITKLTESSAVETKKTSIVKPVSAADDLSCQIHEQMDRIKELKDELYIQQKKTTQLKSRYNVRLKKLKTELSKQAQEHAVRVCELQQQITELKCAAKELQSSTAQPADNRPTTGDTKTRLILELSQKIAEQEAEISELRNRIGAEADDNAETLGGAEIGVEENTELGGKEDELETSHWRTRALRTRNVENITGRQFGSDKTGVSDTLTVLDKISRSRIEVQSLSPRERSYHLHGSDIVTMPIAGSGIAGGKNGVREFSALADIGSRSNSRENSAASEQKGKSLKTTTNGHTNGDSTVIITSLPPHHDNVKALLPSVAT